MATTPAGLYYPGLTDAPNGPSQVQQLALDADPLVIGNFASAAARAAAITSPRDGQLSYNQATKSIEQYSSTLAGGSWSQGGWVTPTLGGSWVSQDGGTVYAIPRYTMRAGLVICDGAMKSGTLAATAWTFPAGFRPAFKKTMLLQSNSGGARVSVTAAGVVTVDAYVSPGSSAFVELTNLTFIAEQ